MYWLITGLFAVGMGCGAILRLPIFLGILFGAALIAAISSFGQGGGRALLNAVVTIVILQIGYGVGFVMRASIRAWFRQKADREPAAGDPARMKMGTKRR